MKKEELTFNKLFYNNRFVLIFSIILSAIIWLIVAMEFSPEVERVLKNVPVKIDLSNSVETFDLQVFGKKDFTVDITVVGKRYEVSSNALSAESFSVTAKTNYVDSAGKQTLQLEVTPKAQSIDYEIKDVSEDYIEVYFDNYKEGEFALVPDIIYPDKVVPDGYFKDKEVLSAKTVTVSGPATEINKISKISAEVEIDKTLTATKTFKAQITPLGEFGSTLKYLTINNGNEDISITIPVYKIVNLPVSVSFKNVPAYYINQPLKYTCAPDNGSFAINEDALTTMSKLNIGTIDFCDLKAGINIININISDISGAKVMDDTKKFRVSIDASGMSEIRVPFKKSDIPIINTPDDFEVALNDFDISSVIVVGPPLIIEKLTSEDIFAEIDLQDVELSSDIVRAKARLFVKNHDDCWVNGSYNVRITVTPKQ